MSPFSFGPVNCDCNQEVTSFNQIYYKENNCYYTLFKNPHPRTSSKQTQQRFKYLVDSKHSKLLSFSLKLKRSCLQSVTHTSKNYSTSFFNKFQTGTCCKVYICILRSNKYEKEKKCLHQQNIKTAVIKLADNQLYITYQMLPWKFRFNIFQLISKHHAVNLNDTQMNTS